MSDPNDHVCACCGADGERKKKCGGCLTVTPRVRYCNNVCQLEHWPIHKLTCNYRRVLLINLLQLIYINNYRRGV